MDSLIWCRQQKHGIELVEPSDNLRTAHLLKAEEALETAKTAKSKDWQITAAYYALYHSTYALLMKLGVKCEIHTCTIEFAKRFLSNHLSIEDIDLLTKAFSARIDAQYYVNRAVPDETYTRIMKQTPAFVVKCKHAVLEEKEVRTIRAAMAKVV